MPRIRKSNSITDDLLKEIARYGDVFINSFQIGNMKVGDYYEYVKSSGGRTYSGTCVGFVMIHGDSNRTRAILKSTSSGGRYRDTEGITNYPVVLVEGAI